MAAFVQDGQPQLSDRGAGVYGGAASLRVHGGETGGVFCADGAGGVEAPRTVLISGTGPAGLRRTGFGGHPNRGQYSLWIPSNPQLPKCLASGTVFQAILRKKLSQG